MNAADFWQLPINGQTPQTFAQNFFHNVRHELRHTDLDRLTFTASGRAIDAAPLMSFGDALAVTRNGKPFFAGTALPPRLVGQNNEENHAYTVVSPWYDLARTFEKSEKDSRLLPDRRAGARPSKFTQPVPSPPCGNTPSGGRSAPPGNIGTPALCPRRETSPSIHHLAGTCSRPW